MNSDIVVIGNILGSILQPLYTCLFILNTKRLKEKRSYFIILTVIDYIIIQNLITFKYGISADLMFVVIMFANLKLIYQNNARVTDLITYIISDIILRLISIVSYFVFGMNFISLIFATCTPLIIVTIFSNKLYAIEKFYNKYWNRKKKKTKIKSITVRGFSLCITVFISLILHFWIIFLIAR